MLMFLLINGDKLTFFSLAACQMLLQFTGILSLMWASKNIWVSLL